MKNLFRGFLLCSFAAFMVHPTTVRGGLAADAPWLVGAELDRKLLQRETFDWHGVPLRAALRQFLRTHRVPVLVDRRVDPEQRLELTLDQATLLEALEAIAKETGQEITRLGGVGYIGPRRESRQLRTAAFMLAQGASKTPADRKSALAARKSLAWPDLATPRELLAELAKEAGIELRGVEQVPHDLWSGCDLSELTWTDRISLVAIQFGLTCEISPDGRTATLVPLSDSVAVERTYPVGNRAEEVAQRWRKLAPESEINVQGDKIAVRGRIEDHERLRGGKPSATRTVTRAGDARQVYTLTVKDVPVERLLTELTSNLKLELTIDRTALEAAGIPLDRRVSLEAKGVTLDELLRQATEPAGLTFRRNGKTVRVQAAGNAP